MDDFFIVPSPSRRNPRHPSWVSLLPGATGTSKSARASSASPFFLFGLDGTCTPFWPESDDGKVPKKFLFVK